MRYWEEALREMQGMEAMAIEFLRRIRIGIILQRMLFKPLITEEEPSKSRSSRKTSKMEGSLSSSSSFEKVAFASGFLLAGASISYFFLRSNSTKARPSISSSATVPNDKELDDEQLSRLSAIYEEDGLEKIKNAFVVVVGLGGE